MTPLNVGWLIGMLEGEGNIHARQTFNRFYPRISIDSTDEDTILRLKEITNAGTVCGPYDNKPGRKPYWRWAIQNKREAARISLIWYQYASTRRQDQIRYAVERVWP